MIVANNAMIYLLPGIYCWRRFNRIQRRLPIRRSTCQYQVGVGHSYLLLWADANSNADTYTALSTNGCAWYETVLKDTVN